MSILPERYEEKREIARGGMGRIVLAHDRYLNRQVAVKILLGASGIGVSPVSQTRFVEEAQITGQLAHPNIVPVHELGGEGSAMYLVMRLVEGQTLKEIVKKLKAGDSETAAKYGLRRLLRLFLGVCEAIGYAHGRNVIHRDIKPANIMVGRDDQVLVMDWGISKPLGATGVNEDTTAVRSVVRSTTGESSQAWMQVSGDITAEGSVVGTPAFMPVEQAEGSVQVDQRADVYALGSTLYYLVTHDSPYVGKGHEIMSQLFRRPPEPPRQRAPGNEIPLALEAIILKAMARDRDDRYADAPALAADIERFLDGEAVSVYSERPLESLQRIVRRNRLAAGVALGCFVLVNALALGGGLLNLWKSRAVQAKAAEAFEQADRAQRAREEARAAAAAIAPVSSALVVATEAERIMRGFERKAQRAILLEQILSDAQREQEERRRAARSPFPDAATKPEARVRAPEPSLRRLHLDAREAIAGCRERLDTLARVLTSGGASSLKPFRDAVDVSATRVEQAMAEALLARAPRNALRFLGQDAARVGPRAPLLRARAHLRLGQIKLARQTLDATPAPAGDRALVSATHALSAYVHARPLEAQLAAFDAAIDANPTSSWLHLRRAEVRVQLGDFAEAGDDYDQAAQLHRIDAWIYSSRMNRLTALWCYEKLTRFTTEFVMDLAPRNLECRMVAVRNALWSRARWKPFVAEIDRIRKLNPLLGNRWGAQGALILRKADAAERYAQALLDADAEDRVGLGCLAEAQLIRNELSKARNTARKGLEIYPQDGRLNTVLGRALMLDGQFAGAAPFLRLGARSNQGSEPWLHLAQCLLESNRASDWEEGVQAARTGMSRDLVALHTYNGQARPVPADPRLHRVAGELRSKQGRPAAAAIHFVKALTLSQEGSKATRALGVDLQDALHAGRVHEQMGLLGEAVQFYAMARQDPELTTRAQARIDALMRPR